LQRRFGIAMFFVGGLIWLVALFISIVHTKGHGPMFDCINSWYNTTHLERSRYGGSYERANGPSVISDMFLAGLFSLLLGTSLVSTPRSKFYSDDGNA